MISTDAVEPLGVGQQPDLHEDALDGEQLGLAAGARCVGETEHLLAVADDLGGRRAHRTSTLGRLRSLRCSTSSALSSSANSRRVTCADDAGEVDGGLDAGVAAADDRDPLALEQGAVAVGAVRDAPVAVLVLAGHVRACASGHRSQMTTVRERSTALRSGAPVQPAASDAGTSRSAVWRCIDLDALAP